MKAPNRVLEALARLYEKSKAGRTGLGELDFQPQFGSQLDLFLKEAQAAGVDIKIKSGYRSPERQAERSLPANSTRASEGAAVPAPGRTTSG